jgi:osmotically-inducible protein OsmY
MATATGCVLVVGDSGGANRGDVEWSSSRGHATSTRTVSVDGSLAREVESHIRLDSSLAGEDITISSAGAVITLHGRVSDIARLEHAMRTAAEVPGVTRVVSRMTVELKVD